MFRFKYSGILFAVLGSFMAAGASHGQLEVGCRAKAAVFLQFEPVVIELEVVNNSSRDLVVGGENANAYFSCEIHNARNERIDARKQSMPEFVIPARGKFSRSINISPYYDLRGTGSYTLRARIEWLDKYFYTKNCYFDIRKGEELVSIVAEDGVTGRFRTFTLETVVRDRQEKVFLRIEDDENCYGVIELGKLLKLYKPTLMADYDGNVHALFHSGPDEYTTVIVSADGGIIERNTHGSAAGVPEMGITEAGNVEVIQPYEDE